MSLITAPTLVTPDGRPLELRDEYEIRIPNVEIVGPRLLILPPVERERHTAGGLIIPEHAKDHTKKGVVLLTGDGVMLADGTKLPPRVEAGWEILYANYAGMEVLLDGFKFIIIQESDVRAILTYRGQVLIEH